MLPRNYCLSALTTALLVSFLINFPHLVRLLLTFYNAAPSTDPFLTTSEYFYSLSFCFLVGFLLSLLHFFLLQRRLTAAIRHLILWPFALLLIHCTVRLHIHLMDLSGKAEFIAWGMFASQSMLVAAVAIFSANVYYLNDRQREHRIEIERLAAENIRSQYNVLKSQIDPHFMFNTLNALNALIVLDPPKAQEYLEQMTTLLRHSLSRRETISLREELDVARSYAYLMNIRYGDALLFNFQIDNRYLDVQMVPYCLQIALENAVKHNTITKAAPLTVHIETRQEQLVVSNLIQKKKEDTAGEGIGLSNLSERFRLMGGKGIEVGIADNLFTVAMPLGG